jgi:ubiquinone biosynthesis protein
MMMAAICAPPLLLRGALRPEAGPRILRWFFERCGGGYVKIGQLLATRYDLLPAAYCEELGKLLDAVRPVPAGHIVRALEESLGAGVSDLYAEFDPVPLATASLAQVHRASLADGQPVVVKVLKPRIEQLMRTDVWCFRQLARLADLLPIFDGLDIQAVAVDLGRSVLAETNLRREALHTAFMHRRMARDPVAHYAPRVYFHLSSQRVLTMERIDGVTVREIINALRRDDERQLAAWAAQGITPQRTAVILVRSVLEQTFRFRRFNADPHPSNLIVSAGGRLNWVDFGLVGWIDERQWQLQLRLRQAFVAGRVHEAYLMILRGIEPIPEGRDLRPFEQMIKQAIHDYMIAAEDADGAISERGTGIFLLRTIEALRRSRLPVAASTLNLYRTIVIADMVMLRLYPGIDWPGHLRRFLQDLSKDLIAESQLTSATSAETALRLARAPVALVEVADWAADQLPQIGRGALARLTFWERFTSAGLRLLRALSLLVAAAAVVLGLTRPAISAGGAVGQLGAGITAQPWSYVALAAAAFVILSWFIRRIENG